MDAPENALPSTPIIRAFAVVVVRLSDGVELFPVAPPPFTSRGVVVSTPDTVTIAHVASEAADIASVTVHAPETVALAHAISARPMPDPKSKVFFVHDPVVQVEV